MRDAQSYQQQLCFRHNTLTSQGGIEGPTCGGSGVYRTEMLVICGMLHRCYFALRIAHSRPFFYCFTVETSLPPSASLALALALALALTRLPTLPLACVHDQA